VTPLTPRLAARLTALFSSEERSFAEQWLVSEIDEDIPGGISSSMVLLERIRAAAMKCSGGSLTQLASVTSLARQDWRDLLMAADFGNTRAHEEWLSEPFSNWNKGGYTLAMT
jgi:hypothetical protein